MAECAVPIVINKTIAAKALLEGEGHDLQEIISGFQIQMETLQSYIKAAQSKKADNFIESIRDLALDVEDFLDTCLPEIEYQKSKGRSGFLKHSSCIPRNGVTDKNLSLKIEEFKKRAAEIERSRGDIAAESNVDEKFGGKTKKYTQKVFRRQETGYMVEKICRGGKKCKIIPIVGDGGVGKTTSGRDIYNLVKNKFDCYAMVYISEESRLVDLLIDIAKQVCLRESQMKQNLQENLHSFLRKKKYVIFLDDYSDKWDVLRDIVMTNSENGSRIIITCRAPEYDKLVYHLDEFSDDRELKKHFYDPICLYRLRDSEGEELLYDSLEITPSLELKNIGDKIVQKCGGLPLAIQVAAGILKAKERSERSWNEVLERMSQGGENCSSNMILDLSYQDLPTKLKPFFLYFGIFPMNREIFVSELIQYWVAEKLVIQADESRKPDKIVEDYIDELIERNLIQVSRRRSDGRVKCCRIQNLLHDLCTRKAEEINFFCSWNNEKKIALPSTARRVITNSSSTLSDQNNFEGLTIPRKLRALFCFSEGGQLAIFIRTYASQLRFLQLLTIEVDYSAINLPVVIAHLSGLIYLKLKGQFITVPSSIRRMNKLQTLEVRSREVPDSVLKMKYLKHLFVTGVIVARKKIRDRDHGLEVNLQNLETFCFDYQYGYHLNRSSFKKLHSLKKLKVFGAQMQMLVDLSATTPLLQKLEDLKLRFDFISASDNPTLDLSRYENLRSLSIFFDTSENISCSFEFPKKLVKITLGGIDTEDKDPLEKLKLLPSLEIIKLKECNAGTIDLSERGNFPQLQMLMLDHTKFQQMVVGEGGMPKISKFIYMPQPPPESKVPEKLRKVMVDTDTRVEMTTSTRTIAMCM